VLFSIIFCFCLTFDPYSFRFFFWIDSFSILSFNFGLVGNWGLCIVFRPGLRLGFRVLTVLPGRPGQNFFLKKSKRRRFSYKKTKNKSQRVAIGSCRVTPGFSFPCFFFNPARFQSRVDPPGRVLKLWLWIWKVNLCDISFFFPIFTLIF
jgi:hypothetical protein